MLLDATAPEPDEIAPAGENAVLQEVTAIRVEPVSAVARTRVSGVLDPRRSVQIFAETRGPVIAIGAEALDRVAVGLELVEIDPLQAEVAVERAVAAVTRAESELALAKSNFDRRASLAERGVASTSVLEDAENARKVGMAAQRDANAELKRARDDLAKKTIRAPFDGVLRSFDVDVGEYVGEGQKLGELPTVTTFCPARVTATEVEAGMRSVTLTGDNVASINTQLLVVADGARSELRGALGIQASDRDYGQVAVVANIQVDARHAGHIAFERFTSGGPLAILPGQNGLYTVVLARSSDSAPTVMALSDKDMLDLVQSSFGFRLGRFTRLGKRYAYPLHLVTADRIIAERAVVIGNAANGLHPVAAQGFNLGLRDVACLGEVIADGYGMKAADFDPGATAVLAQYSDWRQSDQSKVVGFTDSLIRLFGIPGAPVSIGRGFGLAAFDMVPGAKQELARQTMGLSGRLTRLARGLRL